MWGDGGHVRQQLLQTYITEATFPGTISSVTELIVPGNVGPRPMQQSKKRK